MNLDLIRSKANRLLGLSEAVLKAVKLEKEKEIMQEICQLAEDIVKNMER